MQFIPKGPDIPERLLQAHEDGRVVFFCGAGISYPARLRGFDWLTTRLFESLGETPDAVQRAAIKAGQFDTAIGLLEDGIADGRQVVRRALTSILAADLSAPGATSTHEALLTLAKTRVGQTRLITTNFDRLFEVVVAEKHLTVERFRAPLLRTPKNRWDGLVYLHGLLTATPTADDLNCLVVTSGDFGLAYLTERWAARFVSELFRNYTVCFVGYSINDPVMRYMMDALAADRLLGESSPEMFAFGSYPKHKENERRNEWKAKHVTPILYREHRRHAYLHRTLAAWAANYRDGVNGNARIVTQWAGTHPVESTSEDDFIGRMVWALTDPQALPAKRFADFNPVPSLEWLEPLSQDRFRYEDLPRFRVPRDAKRDDALTFSLTRRPAHYARAPRMQLVNSFGSSTEWDEVMEHLGRWLSRHLDDPQLLVWIARRGGRLHPRFADLIRGRLDFLEDLELSLNHDQIAEIQANAPNATPRPAVRELWELVLAGKVGAAPRSRGIYGWKSRFNRYGLTSALRHELRALLTPRIHIRDRLQIPGVEGDRGKDIVNCNVVLSTNHVNHCLKELRSDQQWIGVVASLLDEVSVLLRDAMDLMRSYGGAADTSDFSYIHQPSISDHPQNRGFEDWTALITIARDGWIATAKENPATARHKAANWLTTPYPVFKRLSFFAAGYGEVVSVADAVAWLLSDDAWWLWSVETEREAIALLRAIAARGTHAELVRLEEAILAGPPTEMFRADIEPDRIARIVQREIWLRLAKMRSSNALKDGAGAKRLKELSTAHPEWQLATDERDEFPHWSGDIQELLTFAATPRVRRDLVHWLKRQPASDDWQSDDWRQRCRDDFPTTATALFALAAEGVWPVDRWRDALQAWAEESLQRRSWRYMTPVLTRASGEFLQEVAQAFSWWLQAIAKTFVGKEDTFVGFCQRVLRFDLPADTDVADPVGRAINHPFGHAVDALLKLWHRRTLSDNEGLSEPLKAIFTEVCDTSISRLSHGRVMLAANVLALFRVDPAWARSSLLPLFDWRISEAEARGAWEAFLWSPRLYPPLLEALQIPFLDTASHFADLGEHGTQYASFLTHAALEGGEVFSKGQLVIATRSLPPAGIAAVAEFLMRAQEGAGEQREEYWKNRIKVYLQTIWPKGRDRITSEIAESFARLAVETGNAFPDAVETVRPWLVLLDHADYAVHRLSESGHCATFPADALTLLSSIVSDQAQWMPTDLAVCLNAIAAADPQITDDYRFRNLLAWVQRNQS
jgi:hypothetical protein